MVARALLAAIFAKRSAIARVLATVIIFLFSSAVRMAAVDPHRMISQYGHTAWRTQDGFLDKPSSLTQTTDGYIWVGTSSGLVRFDGVTFRHWTPPGGESLPYITDLLGAHDGSLWIGTADGLFLLKDGVLSSFDKKQGTPGISAIIEDHNGTIWLTRYRLKEGQGPLCRVTGGTLQCFGKNDGIAGRYGLGLTEDGKGNIWFGCQALCRWAPDSSQIYFEEQLKKRSGNGVSRVAIGPSGTVWATLEGIGPGLGVQYYRGRKWSSYVVPGFDGSRVVSEVLLADRNKTLWIGTNSAGLYHIHDGVGDHYGSAQGLSGNYVQKIFEDKEGDIWITTDRGIDCFRDVAVATFSGNEGLIGSTIHSVSALSNGSVWAGTEGALNIIRPDGITALTAGHGLPGHGVKAFFKDSAGRMWLGVDNKIMIYAQGRFSEVRASDGGPPGLVEGAASFAEDVEGNVWILDIHEGGQVWLLRIRGDRIEDRIRIDGLFPDTLAIAADRAGGLWVLYQRSTVARFRNGRAEGGVSLAGSDRVNSYGFFVDSTNVVWFATSRGLYRLKDGAVALLDSRNGLPCSSVFSTIEDNDGALWLYTSCGLVKISKPNFAAWLKSPDSRVQVKIYDALDGVQPDASAEAYEPVVSKSPDGRLWFASDTFVQMVDPGSDTNRVPPPVHIEELLANHKTYADLRKLNLPPLSSELEINYTALSLTVPRRVLFRYKLEGHDSGWQEAGTRRQAFYNDLGPGQYRFRVIACNNDGVWNEAGAFVDFSILPAYYQTSWFRAFCAAVFLLLLWAIYQFRVRQLQRQFAIGLEARVNERTRIARDLHDTLLQTLHGLLMSFQRAANLLPERPVEAKQRLEGAIDQAAQAITEGREAVQGLRSSTVVTSDLALAIQTLGEELAVKQTTQNPPLFNVAVEGTLRDLNPILRDDVYRIAGEALRNAFHHAQARRVEVDIHYDERQLRLRVRDDGKGISAQVLSNEGRSGHWGLQGMSERAKLVGGHLEIWSELDSGTEIELRIPASIAYLDSAPSNREKARQ